MSDVDTASAPTPDAIPRHCTRCDYPLAGLPTPTVCPECGTRRDERFLILRGAQIGPGTRVDTATPRRWIWLTMVLLGWQVLIQGNAIRTELRAGAGWSLAWSVLILVVVLAFMTVAITRRLSISGPPAQLWLCVEGFRVFARTERRQHNHHRYRRIGLVVVDVLCIAGVAGVIVLCVQRSWFSILVAFYTLVFVIFSLAMRQERRRVLKVDVAVPGFVRPAEFTAWQRATTSWVTRVDAVQARYEVVIAPAPPGRFRLELERPTRFLTQLTVSQATMLSEQLARWIAGSSR